MARTPAPETGAAPEEPARTRTSSAATGAERRTVERCRTGSAASHRGGACERDGTKLRGLPSKSKSSTARSVAASGVQKVAAMRRRARDEQRLRSAAVRWKRCARVIRTRHRHDDRTLGTKRTPEPTRDPPRRRLQHASFARHGCLASGWTRGLPACVAADLLEPKRR